MKLVPRFIPRARSTFMAFAFALAASAGVVHAQPANPSAPTDKEIEYWRSVEKLNVDAAYRAYLQEFPSGAFAALAKLAIAKLESAAVTPAQAKTATLDGERVNALKLQGRKTSSVEFGNGARFFGPGVITVGDWGARRQALLPAGEWMAIAGEEHDLVGIATLPLASVAFARFSGTELADLLVVTFNRRSPPPSGIGASAGVSNTPRWPLAANCDSGIAAAVFRLKDSDMRTQWCAGLRTLNSETWPTEFLPSLRGKVSTALAVLGVEASRFSYQSEYHVSDRSGSFVSYVHLQKQLMAPLLVEADLEDADIRVPESVAPALRNNVLQTGHFAYHAAKAFQQKYDVLSLRENTLLKSRTTQQVLGAMP